MSAFGPSPGAIERLWLARDPVVLLRGRPHFALGAATRSMRDLVPFRLAWILAICWLRVIFKWNDNPPKGYSVMCPRPTNGSIHIPVFQVEGSEEFSDATFKTYSSLSRRFRQARVGVLFPCFWSHVHSFPSATEYVPSSSSSPTALEHTLHDLFNLSSIYVVVYTLRLFFFPFRGRFRASHTLRFSWWSGSSGSDCISEPLVQSRRQSEDFASRPKFVELTG